MPNRYVISRSNYTIKKKHQKVKNGNIYERDYMTTNSVGSWSGDVFPYGESNFKMVKRLSKNGQRKRSFGEWVKQTSCANNDNDGDYWTLSCIGDSGTKNDSNGVMTLNRKYNTLLDFAYFGSCVELVKSSINDIISHYPGELYVTDEKVEYYEESSDSIKYLGYNNTNDVNGLDLPSSNNLVLIENPLAIDITSQNINLSKDINTLRYFCQSARKYDILNHNNTVVGCACDWDIIYQYKCQSKKYTHYHDGQLVSVILINKSFDPTETKTDKRFVIYEYYNEGERYLLCDKAYIGFKIRPTKAILTNYFENIDDFESLLLNRESDPLYTCNIENPHETEYGSKVYKKSFTWPTSNGWNLDTSTNEFKEYVNGLLDVAEFYDEGQSNCLVNNMTHDAIKNMDLTYTRTPSNENGEDYEEGTAKMTSLLYVYGRQFDDIKNYIDNISYVNAVTYDKNGNLPDKIIDTSLEMKGWEVYSPINGLCNTAEQLVSYQGYSKYTTLNDCKNEYLRGLNINSSDILVRKGTRYGLEMIMSLFGMKSYDFAKKLYGDTINETQYDYSLKEFVYVAKGGDNGPIGSETDVERYNKMRSDYDAEDSYSLQGLPCVFFPSKDGKKKYLVPWFDKVEEIDGKPYFQMYGGWGKMSAKEIGSSLAPGINTIFNSEKEERKVTQKDKYILSDFSIGSLDNYEVGDNIDFSDILDNGEGYYIIISDCSKDDVIKIVSSMVTGVKIYEYSGLNNTIKAIYDNGAVTCNKNGLSYIITINKNNEKINAPIVERTYNVNINSFPLNIYDESLKYIGIVKNIRELVNVSDDKLHDGSIYYVYDISDYDDYYNDGNNDISHYFILNNSENIYLYGPYGWENIPNGDISNGKYNGLQVLYLESLIDSNVGNAPHIGYGNYDDGNEYLNFFKCIFWWALRNNGFINEAYDCDTGNIKQEIYDIGFDLFQQVDNMKTWCFIDQYDNAKRTEKGSNLIKIDDSGAVDDEFNIVGKNVDYTINYDSELEPYNYEKKTIDNDILSANSIINVKNFIIEFNEMYQGKEAKDFIYNSVLPYVKQVIPSTTILEIKVKGETTNANNNAKLIVGAGLAEDSDILSQRFNS